MTGSGGTSSRPCPGTLTGAHWPWEDQGTIGCLAVEGESYCLTHPCPPGEDQGSLKTDQKIQGLGEDPSINQSALEKGLLAAFWCSWDLFDFWVHIQVGTIKLPFSTFFFTAHLAPLGRPDFIDLGGAREPVVLRSSEASLFAEYIQGLQAAHMQKERSRNHWNVTLSHCV